jgi:glutamine amidotransferase
MVEALQREVIERGRPFLGICVGMQLMAERGVEYGVHQGLGWLKGEVVRLAPSDGRLKVPHMGWNQLDIARPHPLFDGLGERPFVYFLHSYAFRPAEPVTLAETDYGGPVAAAVGRDNMLGVQFHPEKSQDAGLRLIANFLRWRP